MATDEEKKVDERILAFLRDDPLVADEVLEELLVVQRDAWKPFGRVAVELGLVKIVQVAEILSYQATHPERAFGQAALELGLLSSEQVDMIVEKQKSMVPSLAELLVSEMVLEPGELADVMHLAFLNNAGCEVSGVQRSEAESVTLRVASHFKVG